MNAVPRAKQGRRLEANRYLVQFKCPACTHKFVRTIGSLRGLKSVRCPMCKKLLVPPRSGLRLSDMARTLKTNRSGIEARSSTRGPQKPKKS